MATPPRASSHFSEGGTPEPLSPQSRFKAQLAALESSDDETSSSNQYAGNNSKIHLDLPTQTIPDQEASDESDNDIIRPQGKLAAKMQRTWQQKESGNSSSLQKETTGDCIDKTHEPGEKAAGEVEKADNISMPDVESQEDDAPVARRRLVRKAPSSPASKRTPRGSSPTLFVSSPLRPSPTRSLHNGSDSEVDMPTLKPDRFKAMLERRRQKRRDEDAAKEAVEAEKRAKQQKVAQEMVSDDDNSSITDDEGGRRLTQAERPSARKASKKAIEEMERETQRMSRNMQLAHEAKTRKKITKNSLFERFNFRPAGEPEPDVASSSRVPTPHSDVEMQGVDTPLSSPPVSKETATAATDPETVAGDDEFDLPTIDSLAETTRLKPDKGKGKAVETRTEQEQPVQNPRRQFRVKLPPMRANVTMVDSDDELEITTTTKDKIRAVFDMAPTKKAQEHSSVQALRALAQLKSPGKETRRKNENHAMTAGELQAYLYQKARQQAKVERDRRVDLLKAQGVVIQTAEERERQMQDAEDIVARARVEAQMIRQKEKAASKKEAKENGEVDPLAWDDSEDDEYQASGNEADGEGSVVELSGSEDEEELSDEEQTDSNNMVEVEARDGESEAATDENDDATLIVSQDVQDDIEELPATRHRRLRKPIVLSDDEEEEEEEEEEDTVEMTPRPKTTVHMSPTVPNTQSPTAPRSVLRSAKKNFIPGLPVQGPAGLGLTQIFAGTMDDSQMNSADGPTQSLMPDFDHFPDSNFSATMDEPMEDMIVDSQKNTQDIALNLSQSQMRGLDSLLREESTQISEMIDFTQDGGLQDQTPLKNRFVEAPVSTTETMLVDHDDPTQASPLVRRGRLRRKIETSQRIQETPEPVSAEKTDNVFEALREGAKNEHKKHLQPEFDHKNSKAKEMVQEQAEESEDEYAGLGGADGEDSDNESAASLKDIIDDTASNDIDGAKLAALYAAREQAEDEKQVEKLFKDITTGMLRRKRGAGYDLDDSDDDGEARRRMKRRQFAKMQKALFSDERVKKIAENPGNQAFLRTIEDRGSDDEMDFLDAPEEIVESSQSQSQDESSEAQTVPDSQPQKILGPTGNRVPSYLRRTKDGKKPSNIGEVRETLSDLLEEPHGSVIPATDVGSDSEGEENTTTEPRSDKENDTSHPRRGRVAVVDRISLKRNGSSNISTGRLAFATASNSSFKVPALLRRATTNSFVSGTVSTTSSGSPAPASGFGEEAKIKKGAGKKSGVHAFARDSERRAKLEQNERKREERKIKGAERRVGVAGDLLGKGSFE
ncbi:Mediator of replication checkpoint 1 [Fusarium agapanthi]|uniref:Mediator of replication checkpoint 1 n=1 Tax=Fusarium agapanthi TaxID=1803897 RepID=A0A9P5AZD3_9HYPO|nr:Mediator of replication checkpoint 1 [Fusarium agapanthi]